MNPESNQVSSTPGHARCPVSGMDGDPAFKSVYKGETYLACDRQHKQAFDADPAKFANVAQNR
jgi:YHS domain-containing protein